MNDKFNPDDEQFDWDNDDSDGSNRRSDDELGITGELDWMRDPDSGDSPDADDDDVIDLFSWVDDGSAGESTDPRDTSRTGITGELDWMRDSDGEDAPGSSDSSRTGITSELSWLQDAAPADSEFERTIEEAEAAAGFSWGEDPSDDATYTVNEDDAETLFAAEDEGSDEMPPWIADDETPSTAAPPTSGTTELPPWLAADDHDDHDAASEPAAPPTSGTTELPPWLAGGASGEEQEFDFDSPTPPPVDLNLDDDDDIETPPWLVTGPLTPPDDWDDESAGQDEDNEDWLAAIQNAPPAEELLGDDDDVPDWMRGVEPEGLHEEDLFDTDDFVVETEDGAASAAESANTPDWLLGVQDDQSNHDLFVEADELDEDSAALEALFAETPPIDDSSDDLLGALAADTDFDLLDMLTGDANTEDANDDDLLEILADEQPSSAEFSAGRLPEPDSDDFSALFDALGETDESDDDNQQADALFAAANADDFLNAVEPDSDDEDFFAAFEDATEEDINVTDGAFEAFFDQGEPMPPSDLPDVDFFAVNQEPPLDDDPFTAPADTEEAVDEALLLGDDIGESSALFTAEEDWLAALKEPEPETPASAADDDLDSFLNALAVDSGASEDFSLDFEGTPHTPETVLNDSDDEFLLDDIFGEEDDASAEAAPLPTEDAPDWLRGISVDEVSAAALVRSQEDRPIEDLSSRLQALHQRGLEINAPSREFADSGVDAILPGSTQVDIPAGAVLSGEVLLSPEEQARSTMLRSLTHELMPGVDDILLPQHKRSDQVRRFLLSARPERLLIAVLLILAMAAPLVLDFTRIGSLPPLSFSAGSRGEALYSAVNTLQPGAYVLVAVEYGPTAAGELDDLTQALLTHIIGRGGVPVLVSTNPVGLLRANTIAAALDDGQLIRNTDYYSGSYIVADIIGLRNFSQDTNLNRLLSTDVNGLPTGLDIRSLDEFALILVIAERVESVRAWAEQVAPVTDTRMMYATGFAAAPLARPFVDADSGGLLVGIGDAYTYANALAVLAEDIPVQSPSPTLPESTEVTPTPAAPDTTDTAPTQSVETPATAAPTQSVETPATAVPTAQPVTPTMTETIETPAQTPTPTSLPTTTPTITPQSGLLDVFAVVTATQAVNLRAGPGTTFPAVGAVRPDDRLRVLGENDDASWYQVEFEGVEEAWIAAFLVTLEVGQGANDDDAFLPPIGAPPGGIGRLPRLAQQSDSPTQTMMRIAPPATDALTARWYAINLGLIMTVFIIAISSTIGLVRGLLRSRREQ